MARKQKTIHYTYKTTCLVTGRYYIGIHSTNKLLDGYMGSGKRLRYSIRKYGVNNHKKEILGFFETRELLVEAEKIRITPDMLIDNNCMNIVEGGGGFTSEYAKTCVKLSNAKQKILRETNPDWVDKVNKNMSVGQKKVYDEGRREKYYFYDHTGNVPSKETRDKISKNRKGKSEKQNNTCWVSKDGVKIRIKNEELNKFIINGWVRGKLHNILEIIKFYKENKSYEKTSKYFNIPITTIRDNINLNK